LSGAESSLSEKGTEFLFCRFYGSGCDREPVIDFTVLSITPRKIQQHENFAQPAAIPHENPAIPVSASREEDDLLI
jgi:hypothetical protein